MAQRAGLGSALLTDCHVELHRFGTFGSVVLGVPAYYTRFGFKPVAGLVYSVLPVEYFMELPFGGCIARGEVAYQDAFASAA